MFDQKYLQEVYHYDRGVLYSRRTGAPIMLTQDKMHIQIISMKIPVREAVWIYHYGAIPEGKTIVHLDDDSDDAYIESLRLVDINEVSYE